MINRTIYNYLIENIEIKNLLAGFNNGYAIFTYSIPKNINYPAIVFRIEPYEVETKIETNKLFIEIYINKSDQKSINKLPNLIINHLDKQIIKHPDNIDLRLFSSGGDNYKEELIDDIILVRLDFIIRGFLSKWGVKI